MPQARPALLNILKVVTAFTLAHSITLSLAAFDVVRLPSRLTESVIAASIIVGGAQQHLSARHRGRGAHRLCLRAAARLWVCIACWRTWACRTGARLVSLVAFNLGIEAGQLAVVLAVMPLVYVMRSSLLYRRALLPWGSAAIASLALVWLIQRAFLPTG